MSDAQPQRKRKRALLEVVQEDGNSKFARALGSVDSQTREKGLQALTTWLSKRNDISEQELKRLWKGIFYCFWHADRAAFQVHKSHDMHAAERLCSTVQGCNRCSTAGRLSNTVGRNTASPTTKRMYAQTFPSFDTSC